MTTESTKIRLGLDASYDLYAASLPNDDASVADFEAAYRGCAEYVAEKAGIEIRVVRIHGGYHDANLHGRGLDDAETDLGLWQGIHDCLHHDGEEWLYDDAKADRLAERVRHQVANA